MAFTLGNHYIDEILYGVGEVNDKLSYVLDQLSDASIEISADSTDITDKKGNIIRTTYRTKTGTFTATNALFHPAVLNAQSGNEINYATATNIIKMPKIYVDEAGATVPIGNYETGSLQVIGLYGNGANSQPMTAEEIEGALTTVTVGNNTVAAINLPAGGEGLPIQYLIKFERNVSSGAQITNDTTTIAPLNKLTLFCAMGDPCKDDLRPCYVVIPRFAPDPSMTLSLSADETTVDFSGNLNVDYCSGTQALYYIYYPEEALVLSGVADSKTE